MSGTQDKVNRGAKKPRTVITIDVETGDATEKRELPFVVGVMADLAGNNPSEKPKRLSERKFVEINRNNFNDVMRRMKPGVKVEVDNKMPGGEGKSLNAELKFESLDDFEPAKIAEQIPALKELLERRQQLRALESSVSRSEDVEEKLEQVLNSTIDTLNDKSEG
ncbi:MAG: type VI secretion system contractile sheath small subunit [Planctomycetota bacterium]